MMSVPTTLMMTLHLSPVLMGAFPDQRMLREYLQERGLWPDGAIQERWQPDFTTPGAYVVVLEFSLSSV
jgi:hypothetical protein